MSGSLVPSGASLVDWGQLLEVVIAGLVAGIGISTVFSLMIFGAVRAAEAQQASRVPAMVLNAVIALVSFAICVAAVGFGLSAMLSK